MAKYKTRPEIEVEAEEWDGTAKHAEELNLDKKIKMGRTEYGVSTLEGFMKAVRGDYIVIGTEGERYPCKPTPFHKRYIKADNNE